MLLIVRGLPCPGACRILLPQPGIEPSSSTLQGRFLTTGPPGKSESRVFTPASRARTWPRLPELICLQPPDSGVTDWHSAIGHQSTQKGFRGRWAAPSFSPLTAPISTFPRGKSLQRITEQPAEPGSRSNSKSPQTHSCTGTSPLLPPSTQGDGLPRGMVGTDCQGDMWMRAACHPGLGQHGCRAGQLSSVWGQEPGPPAQLKLSVREGAVPTMTP